MKIDPELHQALQYFRELGFTDLSRDALERGVAAQKATTPVPEPSPAYEAPAVDLSTLGLEALEQIAQTCRACKLCEKRNKVVFGSGGAHADLMFIGEGPGANEDRLGLPFVGAAGDLLTKIVEAIGLQREDTYIANIVKCRPPGNRDPQPDEVVACRGYLARQIELIQPKVIVALGRIAAHTLLETNRPVGRMRGQWYVVSGVDTMVTYHPAALLRNASLKRPVWEDMQKVRDRLAEGSEEPLGES